MASTFQLKSQTYETRYMLLTCSQTQNIQENKSVINWTLTVAGGNVSYYTTGPTTVIINDEQVYYSSKKAWDTKQFPAARGTTSGTIEVSHDEYGNATIPLSLETAIYTGVLQKNSGEWELDSIPRQAELTNAPNFNDEENPTITYSNPAGTAVSSLQACIATADGSKQLAKYRDIPKDKTTYTFTLTDEERAALCAETPNSKTMEVSFYVKTTIGDNTFRSYKTKTLTITNAAPAISAIVMDTNSEAVKLTGDSMAKLIKYFSNAGCEMNATPKKSATIKKSTITHNGKTINGTSGTFEAVENASFVFTATDSRGFTASKTITLSLVDYIPLTCNLNTTITLNESDGTKATIYYTIHGNYFNASFGAVNNGLSVYYYLDGVETNVAIPSANLVDGTYSVSGVIENIDYNHQYAMYATASDKVIKDIETAIKQLQALPVFDWSATDFNFNVPVSIKGQPLFDYVIERGEEAMGSNGTWYWEKWASGKAECYGVRNYGNMAVSSAWGSIFISSIFTQTLPGIFSEAPYVCHVDMYGNDSSGAWLMRKTRPSTSDSGQFYVCRGTSLTLPQVYLNFHAIGRWK